MDTFLHTYDHPKLNQEYITQNEIEATESPPKKSPGTDGFSAEFCYTFKE
jgi:hypothetical protein